MTISKKAARKVRLQVNYLNEGKNCGNCKHDVPSVFEQPAFGTLPAIPYSPEICALHDFRVNSHAICDKWEQRTKEKEKS